MSHTIGQSQQNTQESNSNSMPSQDSSNSKVNRLESTSGLSDADYEFLFNQLLEGVAYGWHGGRIVKFFNDLGERGEQTEWIAWLERLRGKASKLPPQSKRKLGTIMIRLGELTQSKTEVKQISTASSRIGQELLFGKTPAEIWEYAGPDSTYVNTRIETEQELSERLPDRFTALSSQTDQKADSSLELDSPWDTTDNRKELDQNIDSETIVDNALPIKEVNRDEVAAINSKQLESKAYSDSPSGKFNDKNSEHDLDLNLTSASDSLPSSKEKVDSAEQIPSYGEEFELELNNLSSAEMSSIDDKTSIPTNQDLVNGLKVSESAPDSHQSTVESSENQSQTEQASTKIQQRVFEAKSDLPSKLATESELDSSSLEVIESWFNLGLKLVSAGEYERAIASWDKALTINANLAEAWHNRGSALGRLGNYEEAVKSFQNALKIDPDNYQAWNDRAHALYQLQNWSDAVESWNRAIKIMPGNHLLWYNRGCALEQLGQWSDALSSYEKTLEIKPDFKPGRSRYINLVADNSRPN